MKDIIAPSILSADFLQMGTEIEKMENGKADWVHFDVMDGVFVPEISYGETLLRHMKKKSSLFFDVHLMIVAPEKHIESFAKAGADSITFHLEASDNPEEVIRLIRENNCKVGISIKPGTPVEKVFPYLSMVDMVLMMTVEPGFGGQPFIPESVDRIRMLKDEIDRVNPEVIIEVDGGIKMGTAKLTKDAGASAFVSGSALFYGDFEANINELRGSLE